MGLPGALKGQKWVEGNFDFFGGSKTVSDKTTDPTWLYQGRLAE
jgi:hypothetical protein